MPSIEYIPVPDLPDSLTQEANRAIRLHSVSMVVAQEDETKGSPCGGVFVILDGLPGILTARHVWERISGAKKVVLMVGPKQVYRIRANVLSAYAPPGVYVALPFDEEIPDIAFVPVSSAHRESIEAKGKAFYSIDRRHSDSAFDLHGDDGFWVAVGSPKELMRPEDRAVSSLTYITNIKQRIEREEWDYLVVNLDVEMNPALPVSNFAGMSGGGIWRVKFERHGDTLRIRNPSRDLLLTGITCLQTSEPGRHLIAHGPRSIYDALRTFVIRSRAMK